MNKIDRFCDRWAGKLAGLAMALYVSLLMYLCFLKYNSFSYYDWDFAADATILWNSVHGKLFYFPFMEEIIFGVHLNLIIALFIPIYALFTHPFTVLVLQTVFLAGAAYPLYLYAKSYLNKTFALCVALVYLLYPAVGLLNLFESHFDIYMIFFLFFALYHFEKGSFNKFLIFIFLTLLCKETASFPVFMFGFYALLRKKTTRWVLAPLFLGSLWFILAVKYVIPYFCKDAQMYPDRYRFTVCYLHLGKTIPEMFKNLIIHPVAVAKIAFAPMKVTYLFFIFFPVSFLSFLSPVALLVAFPSFLQNLLSSFPTHTTIHTQYTVTIIPFVFASLIHGLARLLEHKGVYRKRSAVFFSLLTIAVLANFCLWAPQTNFLKYISAFKIDNVAQEKEKMVAMIPKKAPTIASFQFLPKLANRSDLYSLHFIATGHKLLTSEKYDPPEKPEYALIDFNEPLLIGSFFPPQAPENIRHFLAVGNWRVLKAFDDVVLFRKNYPAGGGLIEFVPADKVKVQHFGSMIIPGKIMFLGFDVESDHVKGDEVLHLSYYWKRIGQFDDDVLFFLEFIDSQGRVVLSKIHHPGYRIYPPSDWSENFLIKEEHWVILPSGVKSQRYGLSAGLYSLSSGQAYPILNDGSGIILKNIFVER